MLAVGSNTHHVSVWDLEEALRLREEHCEMVRLCSRAARFPRGRVSGVPPSWSSPSNSRPPSRRSLHEPRELKRLTLQRESSSGYVDSPTSDESDDEDEGEFEVLDETKDSGGNGEASTSTSRPGTSSSEPHSLPDLAPFLQRARRIMDPCHDHNVPAVCFSVDGARLATASIDSTVRVWDAARGNALGSVSPSQEWGWAVRFAPINSAKPLELTSFQTARLLQPLSNRFNRSRERCQSSETVAVGSVPPDQSSPLPSSVLDAALLPLHRVLLEYYQRAAIARPACAVDAEPELVSRLAPAVLRACFGVEPQSLSRSVESSPSVPSALPSAQSPPTAAHSSAPATTIPSVVASNASHTPLPGAPRHSLPSVFFSILHRLASVQPPNSTGAEAGGAENTRAASCGVSDTSSSGSCEKDGVAFSEIDISKPDRDAEETVFWSQEMAVSYGVGGGVSSGPFSVTD